MVSYELSSIIFNRSPPTIGQANLFWDHEGEYKEKSFANSQKKKKKGKAKQDTEYTGSLHMNRSSIKSKGCWLLL